jgi:hypothetical protein
VVAIPCPGPTRRPQESHLPLSRTELPATPIPGLQPVSPRRSSEEDGVF